MVQTEVFKRAFPMTQIRWANQNARGSLGGNFRGYREDEGRAWQPTIPSPRSPTKGVTVFYRSPPRVHANREDLCFHFLIRMGCPLGFIEDQREFENEGILRTSRLELG